MKIAVIGANSFLANSLLNSIKKVSKHELYLWARRKKDTWNDLDATVFSYDFPDKRVNAVDLLPMDYVFFCSAAGVQPMNRNSVEQVYEVNAFEPIRILNELNSLQYQGAVITFGSYFEIGINQMQHNFSEMEVALSELAPLNVYSTTKRLLTRFVYDLLEKERSFKLFHFFLSNIYGYGENSNRLIPYVVNSIIEREVISLGTGSQLRQYTHIKDIATFLLNLIDHSEAEEGIYCLSVNEEHTVRQVLCTIAAVAESHGLSIPDQQFNHVQRTDQSATYLGLNSGKALIKLNWSPSITLEEGVKEYIINLKEQ